LKINTANIILVNNPVCPKSRKILVNFKNILFTMLQVFKKVNLNVWHISPVPGYKRVELNIERVISQPSQPEHWSILEKLIA
jgi:hypothetical protein